MKKITLNADVGESFGAWKIGNDAAVMSYIDRANIACGYHAGDPVTMERTVMLAKEHGVEVGAHPGYPDREGFGRRAFSMSPVEIKAMVLAQVGALREIAHAHEMPLGYVKPHGALYHEMMLSLEAFGAILEAVEKIALPLMVFAVPEDSEHQRLADGSGVSLIHEAFIDRAYRPDGTLISRSEEGALLTKEAEIFQRVKDLLESRITAVDGTVLPVSPDTVCVHGDEPESIARIAQIRNWLDNDTVA